MISRGVGRAIAGLALIAAVSACDDNPLAENREDAEYFRLSVSDAVVEVDGTVGVVANVLNQYGAALVVNVTASECDARVSVEVDTIRSEYEYPERFLITGNSVGESCVVVTGGGVTDTIRVRVVPAAVDLELPTPADTIVGSGEVITLPIAYLGADGGAAPGLGLDETTTFTVVNGPIGLIDEQGNFTGREPGTTYVRATWSDMGVERSDSVRVTVVPGEFNGTEAQAAYGGGQAIEFTAGAFPFDENTRVEFTNVDGGSFVHAAPNTATTLRGMIPAGTPAGTEIEYVIINAGPNDFALAGSFTTTAAAPAIDPFLNNTDATAREMEVGEDMFGTIAGVRGAEEWFVVEVTEAGNYLVEFSWADGDDKDLYVYDASDGSELLALENTAATNPESEVLELEPGTYYLVGSTWTPNPGDAAFYRMRFSREPDEE